MTEHIIFLNDTEARAPDLRLIVRPVRPQPAWEHDAPDRIADIVGGFVDGAGVKHKAPWHSGDVLLGKEAWAPHIGPFGESRIALYRADFAAGDDRGGPWRSPVIMPRDLIRWRRPVVEAGVMRVQEITEEQAIATGITWDGGHEMILPCCMCNCEGPCECLPDGRTYCDKYYLMGSLATAAFGVYWDYRYDKRGLGWDTNLWTWFAWVKREDA